MHVEHDVGQTRCLRREAAMFLRASAGPESDWLYGQIFADAGGWVV